MVTGRRLALGAFCVAVLSLANVIRADADATTIDANLVVVGRDPASVAPIKAVVRCAPDGPESPVTTDGEVLLRVGAPTTFDDVLARARAVSADRAVTCSMQAVDVASGSVEYLTTQAPGVDGVRPAALPGRVSSSGFRSSPAAVGQSITATLRFTGDLSVAVRSTDPSASAGSVGLSLRCRETAVNETFRLRPGERRVRTGITVGTICTLSADVTSVRFDDTSGAPNDATVTVIETPSSCWDLRVTDVGCRTTIVATVSAVTPDQPDAATVTTSPPTTTPPDNNQTATTAAPAPAPTPAPAAAVVAEPAFTG
jgi:hypothetical protein